MKLMTEELERKLERKPLYSTDGRGKNAEVVVKYFNPCGAGTWLITEGEKQDNGDWLLYGYCHIVEWEWGYLMLSDLEKIKLPFGLTIERDLYEHGTVAELCGDKNYNSTNNLQERLEQEYYLPTNNKDTYDNDER